MSLIRAKSFTPPAHCDHVLTGSLKLLETLSIIYMSHNETGNEKEKHRKDLVI